MSVVGGVVDSVADAVTFEAADTGTYQIEVHGFTDATYNLTFGSTNVVSSLSLFSGSERMGPKTLPTEPAVPLDEQPEYFPDPPEPATATPTAPASDQTIYLPMIIR